MIPAKFFISSILLLFALLGMDDTIFGQVNVPQNSDPCIDLAREAAYAPLQNFFPHFTFFSISLPTSRRLFQHLYSQTFTSASFNEYCKAYENGRLEYNKCPESRLKAAVLSGYRLADYICIGRLNDFASHLPCLQTAYNTASDQCRTKCQYYEQESIAFLDSTSNSEFLLSVNNPHLPGDCRYLDCLVSCRKSIFEQQCGKQAADLDWQALQITAQSMQELHDFTSHHREYYELENGRPGSSFPRLPTPTGVSTFPVECRRLSERYVGYYSGTDRVKSKISICILISSAVLLQIVL